MSTLAEREHMGRRRLSRYGLANLSLGLSILFAVAAFVYLALAGSPLRGAALGGLVLAAGYWEYRRKIQDKRTSERYEAEAEAQKRRREERQ
jgi:hypothetical protein